VRKPNCFIAVNTRHPGHHAQTSCGALDDLLSDVQAILVILGSLLKTLVLAADVTEIGVGLGQLELSFLVVALHYLLHFIENLASKVDTIPRDLWIGAARS